MYRKLSLVFVFISLMGIKAEFYGYDDPDDFSDAIDVLVTNLGGINCIAETLQNLEGAAKEFSYKVNNSCKPKVAIGLKTELEDIDKLITVIDKFENYNKKTCKNANYNEDDDADTPPSKDCSKDLKALMNGKYWKTYTKTKSDMQTSLEKSQKNKDVCQRMALVNFNFQINNFEIVLDQCVQVIQSSE